MKSFIQLVLALGFVLLATTSYGQHVLQILPATGAEASLLNRYSYKKQQTDSLTALQETYAFVQQLQQDGYLLAQTVRMLSGKDSTQVYIYAGEPFSWVSLRKGNVEERALQQAGYRERFYRQKPFSYTQVAQLMQQLIVQAERQGYPFAQVRLDSLQIDSTRIAAALAFDQGPYITFDSLQISGDVKIKQRFLASHLGIVPGEPFNQQLVTEAAKKLSALSFVRLQEPPAVSFQNRQARLWLRLKRQPANRIDGILGLQSKPEGGVLLTGQLDLLLQNPFGGGKTMAVNWQRLNEASQRLELLYRHPYLLGSPLSLLLQGNLLKEHEQFLNRNVQVAFQVRQSANLLLSLEYQFKDARLLDNATGPNLASFSLHKYGVRAEYQRLDNLLFPRQGFFASAGFLLGPKTIKSVADGSAATVGKSTQITAELALQQYWPLSARTTLALLAEGAWLDDKQLFLPDLYRLGGLRSIRGFREKALFAGKYGLVQAELRQQFGNSSYLFLFYDQALLAYELPSVQYKDWPSGVGAGLSLQTDAGLFSLVYALGNQRNQPFSLRNSQVHFGYTSRF